MEEYLPILVFSQISPDMKKRNHKSADCDRTVEYSEADRGGKKILRRSSGKTEILEKSGDIFLQKKIKSISSQRERREGRY